MNSTALQLLDYEAPSLRHRQVSAMDALISSFVPKLVCKPTRGQDTLKIGIFAGLHGDEAAGTLTSYELMRWAWNDPIELQDYELHIYPICNPTGRSKGTRHSQSGVDLNREFWTGSQEPEVRYLESELLREEYDGIISLHSDDQSDGLYGFVSGIILSEHVLQPALAAASSVLPLNENHHIDGFNARQGIIKEGYKGVLSAPPELPFRPLEIVFETPALAPMRKQVKANVIAVKTILAEYRRLVSYAENI